jgi:L-alanine-DL-glutamate epimerase-like enolase superfamily enzyme
VQPAADGLAAGGEQDARLPRFAWMVKNRRETWYSPALEVSKGVVAVPDGPGLGITIDAEVLRKAKRV